LSVHGSTQLSFEYEMRWVPDDLPPTPIGVARSLAHLQALLHRDRSREAAEE
jgi:hypothetical protein